MELPLMRVTPARTEIPVCTLNATTFAAPVTVPPIVGGGNVDPFRVPALRAVGAQTNPVALNRVVAAPGESQSVREAVDREALDCRASGRNEEAVGKAAREDLDQGRPGITRLRRC